MSRATLGSDHQRLLAFMAATAARRPGLAGRELAAARRAGLSRRRAEEAALMLVLYAGYPAAFAALEAIRAEWPEPAKAAEGRTSRAGERRRGLALSRRVYGTVLPRLLARVRGLHPDIARWMIEEGYGRVLSRPGMGARERELVTVAALAALGWEPQLVSHLIGAQRLGATLAQRRAAWASGRAQARDGAARAASQRAWLRAMAVAKPGV